MKLDVGSMDKVPTGPETLPALKNVAFRVVEPDDTADIISERSDGRIQSLRLPVRVAESTPYNVETEGGLVARDAQDKILFVDLLTWVDKDFYLTWKGATEQSYEDKLYLRDLKRFGNAIGVDFSRQDVEDAYGKLFKADIARRTYESGGEQRTVNNVRNFRPVKD